MAKPHTSAPSNLEVLIVGAEARAVATALTIIAGSIAFVALSFSIYALLETFASRALAAGLTALVFAILAGIIALLVPRMIRARASRARPAQQHWAERLRPLLEGGVVVGAILAESFARQRLMKARLEHGKEEGPKRSRRR